MQGRYLYQKQCMVCHGRTGRGDGEFATDVTIKPRNFRTGVFKFRTTPMGKLPTDADLERTIRTGVSGTMMPTFASMSDGDLRAVITYIKAFSRRWQDEELVAEPIDVPAAPDWFLDAARRGAHAENGAKVFAATCVSCHGTDGEGDGPASKALVDTWGNPIVPADLSGPHHRSGPKPTDLFRTIAMGLDGTPMVGFLTPLGAEAIWDLVAYIESLPESGSELKSSR